MDEGPRRPPSPINSDMSEDNMQDLVNIINIENCDEIINSPESPGSAILISKRPVKRPRDNGGKECDEDSEGYTVVQRKHLKKYSGSNNKPSENNDFEVCISSYQLLPKQIGLAKLLKSQNIENVLRIKYKNAYKALLTFECKEDAMSLINNAFIIEQGYRCYLTTEVGISYGIVRYLELDADVQDMVKSFHCDYDIVSVKRLKRLSDNGEWVDSETVRFGFKSSVLPLFVYGYDCRFKIETYTFPVTQCNHCWNYGHFARTCPTKRVTCPKCGGEHANCDTTQFRCVNCRGGHISFNKTCPVFIKERELRIIMSKDNCTYKAARAKYVEKRSYAYEARDESNTHTIQDKYIKEASTMSYSQSVGSRTNQLETSIYQEIREQVNDSEEESKENYNVKNRNNKKKNIIKQKPKTVWYEEEDKTHQKSPEIEENSKEKRNKLSFFINMFQKTKEIIFSQDSVEEKIKQVIYLLIEEIISLVMTSVSNGEVSRLINLFSNG